MQGNNQIESWNQQNRNKENNIKNQWDKELVLQENQQFRQTLSKLTKKAKGIYPNYPNQEWKEGYSNRPRGNPENHQIILQNPVLHKIGKHKGKDNFLDKHHLPK